MITALAILIGQGLLGALDNLIHHELQARLPARVSARWELTLHAAREAIYGLLFLALAWAEWHGVWAWLLAALLLVEIVITLADFLEEDVTRRLPPFERVLHTVLALSYGAFLAAFAPVLLGWATAPTAIVGTSYGFLSWLLTLYAAGVLAWSLRNAVSVVGLYAAARQIAPEPPAATGDAVLVTGGTGFIGTALIDSLLAEGRRVILLTRDSLQARAQYGGRLTVIDDLDILPPETRIAAIVNLAGAAITGGLWTRRRKSLLVESRLRTTRGVNALIARLEHKPGVVIGASAVGYYGDRGAEPLAETASAGTGFPTDLCTVWEAETNLAARHGVRVVALRFGLVLGRDGGIFPALAAASWLGGGAVLGTGRQHMPWIHIDDAVGLIRFAMADDALVGPVNATAPDCRPQADFAAQLARAQHRPQWLRIPARLLTTALGELSRLLLDSQQTVPTRAIKAGFRFRHPSVPDALADLVAGPSPSQSAVPTGE